MLDLATGVDWFSGRRGQQRASSVWTASVAAAARHRIGVARASTSCADVVESDGTRERRLLPSVRRRLSQSRECFDAPTKSKNASVSDLAGLFIASGGKIRLLASGNGTHWLLWQIQIKKHEPVHTLSSDSRQCAASRGREPHRFGLVKR